MKFLIAGDFYPCTEKSKQIIRDKDFEKIIHEVKPFINEADFSLVNFESPIANERLQSPFIKKGPRNLCSDKNAIECIKTAGFTMAALANNHFHDYGDVGVMQTLNAFNEIGMHYCGAGMNLSEAQQPKCVVIQGKKISVINFCENEFSVATTKSAGSNPFNLIDVLHQIQQVRSTSNYVIIFIHGGVEHYQLPTPMMQKTYRYLIEVGADMVINCHQHCFSGFEIYQNKPIIYGLGNFFFDNGSNKVTLWNEGYMVKIEEIEGNYRVDLIPYIQGTQDKTISIIKDRTLFDQRIKELNKIILDYTKLEIEFEKYVSNNKRSLLAYFEPYSTRVALKLYRMGILPSLLSNKKRVLILNRLRCESHRLVYSKVLSQSLGFPF